MRPPVVLRSTLQKSHQFSPADLGAAPADIIALEMEDMAVSQDVQTLAEQIAGINAKWQTYCDAQVAAAVAAALAQAKIDQDAAVSDAVAQVQQDHTDEVAALNAALASAAPPSAPQS